MNWQISDVVWYIHNICIYIVENVELCWIDWLNEVRNKMIYIYIYLYLLRMLNCVEWSDGIWCEEMLVCWNVSYAYLCELIENGGKWIKHELKCELYMWIVMDVMWSETWIWNVNCACL